MGEIISEHGKMVNGRMVHNITLTGWTGSPQYSRFKAHPEDSSRDMFITSVFTDGEEEPEKHKVIFWGELARVMKKNLMDCPRTALIHLINARVDHYLYEKDEVEKVGTSLSVNYPRQVRVLEHRDYVTAEDLFENAKAQMDEIRW